MSELDLARLLRDEIGSSGPIRFSRWVERALYEPGLGFYETGGAAGGRRGDFVTSVETGPLFAAVVGEWLDRAWISLGRPATFVVAEAGAGVGTLWRGVRRAKPGCFEALEWILVERSARLRQAHDRLPPGRWASTCELPERADVIVANELLDNLVFDVARWSGDRWDDVRVGVDDADRFRLVGHTADPVELAVPVGRDIAIGAEVPVCVGALEWLELARHVADRVLVFDYGADTATLAQRGIQGWLRTYAGHARGGSPLESPGCCDITHDVAFDQLPTPKSCQSQADWLDEHGIEELVESAHRLWNERSEVGDLESMFARSAITEFGVLTDPTALGGFSVLEW